ncbi:hypothetical protein D3C81_1969920 [compost metagenome]
MTQGDGAGLERTVLHFRLASGCVADIAADRRVAADPDSGGYGIAAFQYQLSRLEHATAILVDEYQPAATPFPVLVVQYDWLPAHD